MMELIIIFAEKFLHYTLWKEQEIKTSTKDEKPCSI